MSGIEALIPYLYAAATAVSVGSAIESADDQRRQFHFAQDQAREDAKAQVIESNINASNAGQTELDTQQQWSDLMRQRSRVLGQNVSAAAKSGLLLDGSVSDVMNDTAMTFAVNANRTLFSGLNEAGNYRAAGAANLRSRTNLLKTAGNYGVSATSASRAGALSATGRLFSGIGDSVSAGYKPGQGSVVYKTSMATPTPSPKSPSKGPYD